jgi:hypothetical protein
MNLYIQIENDQPINHPALMDNLFQSLGGIPPGWEQFIRVPRPVLGAYQVLVSEEPTYTKQFGYWMDTWTTRDMTDAEKAAKQQATRDAFNARPQAENWSAWTLDEATCTMAPPIPRPEPDQTKLDQRIFTYWCGAEVNWKDTPVCPEGNYTFDFIAWQWVEAVN